MHIPQRTPEEQLALVRAKEQASIDAEKQYQYASINAGLRVLKTSILTSIVSGGSLVTALSIANQSVDLQEQIIDSPYKLVYASLVVGFGIVSSLGRLIIEKRDRDYAYSLMNALTSPSLSESQQDAIRAKLKELEKKGIVV